MAELLQGTEKEVAWAEQIRTQKLNDFQVWAGQTREAARTARFDFYREAMESLAQGIIAASAHLERLANARWWIAHRDHGRLLLIAGYDESESKRLGQLANTRRR
jgi:hypothetical protein